MDQSCLLEIDFQLSAPKRREFNYSLESLMGRDDVGYVRCTAFEDRDDRDRFLLVSEWSSRAALETYLQSETYGALLGCLKTLGVVLDCRVVNLYGPVHTEAPSRTIRWVTGEMFRKESS